MCKIFKRYIPVFLSVVMTLITLLSISSSAYADNTKHLRILFTHDIHSYVYPVEDYNKNHELVEHGDIAKLKTLVDQYKGDDAIYVDGGDIAMGTLFQSEFANENYELRLMGMVGCDVLTVGNHEWDYGGYGFADSLIAAKKNAYPDEKLPQFVQSNLDFSGELTDEQKAVRDALEEYGSKEYTIIERNGVKIAVFGVLGNEAIEYSVTGGMKFINYIEAAKKTVEDIKNNTNADIIICLSHSGTDGDGEKGEDFELLKEVPDIDVVISAHSHDQYDEPVYVGDSILVSGNSYLYYLGCLDVDIIDGKVKCTNYELIPVDSSVTPNEAVAQRVAEYKQGISDGYLEEYGLGYDEVICRSDFDFITLDDMYNTHGEYPLGDLIADSYMFAAEKYGVNLDVAAVGLGTIRNSIRKGDITTANVFEMCSLGVGSDMSAGHPLVIVYITGEELKLLAELDASLGPMVSSVKMSYAGLNFEFNDSRMLLDKVTNVSLVRPDGTKEEIEDDKLYSVCANVYAANMIGMVNGLTKGILTLEPKMQDGTLVTDIYDCTMKDNEGKEVKEWKAFADYLSSFDKKDGVPTIGSEYEKPQGRKVIYEDGGIEAVSNPGPTTIIVMVLGLVLILVIVLIVRKVIKKRQKKL